MMDPQTKQAYATRAREYSKDWLAQPEPSDMYDLLNKYFVKGGEVADIGCGNGRDSHWLSLNGFKPYGFDGSLELLKIASGLFPQIKFEKSELPTLREISRKFENVLCETVIMHLPKEQILESLENLKRILKKGGVLYLSWRVTEHKDFRHEDGRLYSSFEPEFIKEQFPKNSILHFEDKISRSSGKRICRLLYRAD